MSVDLSLNEVEATATKAARGAGLSWGLAEETGKAARWLAARALPWAESLLDLLAGGPAATAASPLDAGCRLMDDGALLSGGAWQTEPTAHPLWLLPFAARAARFHGTAIALRWPGAEAMLAPAGDCFVTGDPAASTQPVSVTAAVESVRPSGSPIPTVDRAAAAVATWAALEELAAKTYVPASMASRERGAGAGLTDND